MWSIWILVLYNINDSFYFCEAKAFKNVNVLFLLSYIFLSLGNSIYRYKKKNVVLQRSLCIWNE